MEDLPALKRSVFVTPVKLPKLIWASGASGDQTTKKPTEDRKKGQERKDLTRIQAYSNNGLYEPKR